MAMDVYTELYTPAIEEMRGFKYFYVEQTTQKIRIPQAGLNEWKSIELIASERSIKQVSQNMPENLEYLFDEWQFAQRNPFSAWKGEYKASGLIPLPSVFWKDITKGDIYREITSFCPYHKSPARLRILDGGTWQCFSCYSSFDDKQVSEFNNDPANFELIWKKRLTTDVSKKKQEFKTGFCFFSRLEDAKVYPTFGAEFKASPVSRNIILVECLFRKVFMKGFRSVNIASEGEGAHLLADELLIPSSAVKDALVDLHTQRMTAHFRAWGLKQSYKEFVASQSVSQENLKDAKQAESNEVGGGNKATQNEGGSLDGVGVGVASGSAIGAEGGEIPNQEGSGRSSENTVLQ